MGIQKGHRDLAEAELAKLRGKGSTPARAVAIICPAPLPRIASRADLQRSKEGGAGLPKESRGAPGPLAGIRVLDLSRVLAGPWCTQCFADLGADVLKIEEPTAGDDTRSWGPPYMGGIAAYFTCANRSKRSLAVDLKDERGRALVRALAAHADVLVENFRTGTLDRFGLGYEALAAENPGLIYCSISGYGLSGPQVQRPGYDFVIQGESGLMSITGAADGPPMKVGVAVSDLFTGLYASQAILAALLGRGATGRGQHIDAALFDCQVAALANVAANTLANGVRPARYGNAHPNIVPYDVFEAADQPFVLAIGNDRQFRSLCVDVLERPELALDPRFRRNAERSANRDALIPELRAIFVTAPVEKWLARLAAAGLPSGRVRTVDEALASEQARARGLVHEFAGDEAGPIRVVRYPVRFSDGLPEPRRPPRIGEGGAEAAREWQAKPGTRKHS